MSKIKWISITILVIAIITFVVYNVHTTNIYIPFIKPVEIKVIFLLIIGFLIGSVTVSVIIILDRHNKKNMQNKLWSNNK